MNKGKSENLETVLRTARLELLSKAAKDDSVETILTAHHQDDQYETVIQRLASGSTFAGLGGIPIKNGIFRRPLLDYPKVGFGSLDKANSKARLRATCELHDVTWVEDPTNSDPTYALRNAIRQIVKVQDDLPDALRKENVIALAARGNQFRACLVVQVNSLIRQCIFRREAFTGMMKVELPRSTYDNPPRVLGHFITALSRIFKAGKVEEFSFHGVGNDRASAAVILRFYYSHYFVWNVMSTQFRRLGSTEDEMYTLLLTPEVPRAAQRRRTPVSVRLLNEAGTGRWKETSFDFPEEWWQPSRISIYVQKDRDYYLRYFDRNRDLRSSGKPSPYHRHMSKQDKIKFDNALVRASVYLPNYYFSVLCHKEGNHEIIDAFPHFEISLSPDVKVTAWGRDGKFNLHQAEREWVDLEDLGRTEHMSSAVFMKR